MPETPFDQLAERYGPGGDGAKRPCEYCGMVPEFTQHTHLDDKHPLLEALWETWKAATWARYARRSREEAWYLLPEALEKMGYAYALTDVAVTLWVNESVTPWTVPLKSNEHPLDALARAILKADCPKGDA